MAEYQRITGAAMLRVVTCSAGLLCCGQASGSAPTSITSPFDAIAASVRHKLASHHSSSVALAVSQNGRILWRTGIGFADREKRVPATADLPYAIASVSKSLTAAGIMLLAQDNALDLDAPINRFLGPSRVRSFRWDVNAVTVRRIAQHRAGLTTYFDYCEPQLRGCTYSPELTANRYAVAIWKPGTVFDYSNLGYGLLGDVIANVSHQTYAKFMHDRVFTPLGMTHSFVAERAPFPMTVAPRYVDGTARVNRFIEFTPAASGVYASANDLNTFGMSILAPSKAQKSILLPRSVALMLDRTTSAGGTQRYGLGWWEEFRQYGYRVVYAQGGAAGDNAALVLVPSAGLSIAVAANTDKISTLDIAGDIIAALLPPYARARSHAHQHQPVQTQQKQVRGVWSGYAYVYNRRVPVELHAQSNSQAFIKIDDKKSRFTVNSFRKFLVGSAAASLNLDEIPNGAYDMDVELAQADNVLYGALTTNPHRGARNAGLSFWTELHRTQ